MGALKHLKSISDITRRFTGLADVPGARLQALHEEIRFAEGRKDGENALLTASKGVLAGIPAITLMMDLILKRGDADPELDAQADNMLSTIKVLVATHSQICMERVLSLEKVVHTRLEKELIKEARCIRGGFGTDRIPPQ